MQRCSTVEEPKTEASNKEQTRVLGEIGLEHNFFFSVVEKLR